MNTIILDGEIMNDISLKETKDHVTWTSFLLNNTIRLKEGKKKSLKVRCAAFDKCAKALASQCKKDDHILIRGRISVKIVDDGNHKKKYFEVIIREYEKLDS